MSAAPRLHQARAKTQMSAALIAKRALGPLLAYFLPANAKRMNAAGVEAKSFIGSLFLVFDFWYLA
jgi:hypothetical protein